MLLTTGGDSSETNTGWATIDGSSPTGVRAESRQTGDLPPFTSICFFTWSQQEALSVRRSQLACSTRMYFSVIAPLRALLIRIRLKGADRGACPFFFRCMHIKQSASSKSFFPVLESYTANRIPPSVPSAAPRNTKLPFTPEK